MTEVYPQEQATAVRGAGGAPAAGRADDVLERVVRVVVRPLASPLPLALFAFAIASVLVALQQLGVVPQSEQRALFLTVAVLVGPAQLLAAVLAFLTREPLLATGIGIIALAWPATAVATLAGPPGAQRLTTLGLLYLCLAGMAFLIAAPAAAAKPLLSVVILVASVRFLLTGIYELSGSTALEHASGVLGLVLAAGAAYAGLATGLEDTRHQTVLPTLRVGEAKQAFSSDLREQLETVATEAGVRRQL